MKTNTKKLLSILLALMMMLSAVPFYASAEETLTPVLIDEVNDPPVATAVEAGARLSTSTISGGAVKNPLTNEPIEDAVWAWQSSRTKVYESGFFPAYCVCSSIDYPLLMDIYVKIVGEAVATTITEAPTVADMTYGTTRNDIVLVGGKAMAGDVEVPGKFTLDYTDDTVMNVGTYNLAITFTPDDTESYLPSTGTATVTVNKSNYKFVDENGDVCVPEITVPYGTSLEDVSRRIRAFIADVSKLTGADVAYISFPDNDATATLPVGTNTYNVRVRPSHEGNSNYNTTDLQFVLTVEPTDVKVNIPPLVGTIQVRKTNFNDPTPTGTFAIYVDGQLLKDGVKLDSPVEWNPTVSKEYEIKAVYTPAENDPVNVEDVTITTIRNLERKITYISQVNGGNPSYLCGATVTLSAAVDPESFETWVITDANGNAVDLGVDLTNSNISFTMPDFDLNIEAKTKGSSLGGGLDIDNIFGDMTEGDSDCWLINIINNIIAKMKQIITTVTNLFRSIGDNT